MEIVLSNEEVELILKVLSNARAGDVYPVLKLLEDKLVKAKGKQDGATEGN